MGELREFRLPDVGEGLTEAEILSWHVAPGDRSWSTRPSWRSRPPRRRWSCPAPTRGWCRRCSSRPATSSPSGPRSSPSTPTSGRRRRGAAAAPSPDAPARTAVLVGYGVKRVRRRAPPAGARPGRPADGRTGTASRVRRGEAGRARPHRRSRGGPARWSRGWRPTSRCGPSPRSGDWPASSASTCARSTATGHGGVVTRDDVERAARLHATAPAPVAGSPLAGDPAAGPREERVPVRGVLRAMADAMVRSAFTAPARHRVGRRRRHAHDGADRRLRRRPELDGVKVTPLTLVAAGLVRAAREHPRVNATFDADAGEVVVKHYVNLGIAAATPRGLVVPNVKDADRLGLVDLARALQRAHRRRAEGRTPPADMPGGTITITNVGVFGVDGGTPIINPGEVAILAAGRVLSTTVGRRRSRGPEAGHAAVALVRPPLRRRCAGVAGPRLGGRLPDRPGGGFRGGMTAGSVHPRLWGVASATSGPWVGVHRAERGQWARRSPTRSCERGGPWRCHSFSRGLSYGGSTLAPPRSGSRCRNPQ